MINVASTDADAITVQKAAAALATPPASPISTDRRSRHIALGIETWGLNGSATVGNGRDAPFTHMRNLSVASAASIDSATPLLYDAIDKQLSRIDEDEPAEHFASATTARRPRALSLEAGRRASIVVIVGLKDGFDRNRGLMLIGAAQLAFALMNATVKIMTRDEDARVPTWQLIFSRQAITWLCCYLTLRWQRIPDPCWGPKEVRGLLFLRGCAGCVGLFSAYTSIQYLSLSDVTVLSFLAPATTSIAAYYCLAEPYHLREAIAGLLSLFGTVFVAQPTFIFGQAAAGEDGVSEEERLMAVAISLFGVVGATVAYVTLRKIGTRANALQGVEYFAIGCTLMSVIMPLVLKDQPFVLPRKPIFWAYLGFIGVFGFIAQMAVGRALQVSSVGRSLLGSFVQLPFSLIIQYYLFNEKMDLLSGIGSLIILSSTCWIVFGKDQAKSDDTEAVKEGARWPLLDAEAAIDVRKASVRAETSGHALRDEEEAEEHRHIA